MIHFTGPLYWIILTVGMGTTLAIVVLGTYVLWTQFIVEVIIPKVILSNKSWKLLIRHAFYSKPFWKWYKSRMPEAPFTKAEELSSIKKELSEAYEEIDRLESLALRTETASPKE